MLMFSSLFFTQPAMGHFCFSFQIWCYGVLHRLLLHYNMLLRVSMYLLKTCILYMCSLGLFVCTCVLVCFFLGVVCVCIDKGKEVEEGSFVKGS